jgi:hypothetical protein
MNTQLINWLEGHLAESELLHAQFEAQAKEEDYTDHELEISRHTEDGFKSALQFVINHLKEKELTDGEVLDQVYGLLEYYRTGDK